MVSNVFELVKKSMSIFVVNGSIGIGGGPTEIAFFSIKIYSDGIIFLISRISLYCLEFQHVRIPLEDPTTSKV